MMKRKVKRKAMTLLEIMIVIFLIGLIGSVIGYNMKGSLDKGKMFKTEKGAEQIRDILMLEVAQGASPEVVVKEHARILRDSGLFKDVDKILKDGWNQPYDIGLDDDGEIYVRSSRQTKKDQ